MEAIINRLPISGIKREKFKVLDRFATYNLNNDYDPANYKKRLGIYLGDNVLLEDVSEYAADGGPIEAFAEVFRLYVTKGPGAIGPFTLELFKKVTRSGGMKLAVVQRFICKTL